jgi:uncharacterized RDD family membrane protein YckC
VSDYYELLGVEAGADKETIRSAYREQLDGASQTERARLNKAWNVLSDPVQRERYDDARAEGWLDDADAEDDQPEDDVVVPGRRPTRSARTARPDRVPASRDRAVRPPPEPTVVLPEGMQLADPRQRGTALLIDFSVLFVIYIAALGLLLPSLIKSQYPVQSKRIDAVNRDKTTLDEFKGFADSRGNRDTPSADDAKTARTDKKQFDADIACMQADLDAAGCSRAKQTVNDRIARTGQSRAAASSALVKQLTTQSQWAQARIDRTRPTVEQAKSADAEGKRLQKQMDDADDTVSKVAKDFQSFALLMYAVLLGVFLLYTVPSTAITGQTLGMRIRKVRVVRADGGHVGWLAAFSRFVVPLAIALLLPQLGALIGLGLVLWFLRDKNRQGVHDKLARTLVVEA